MLDEETKSNIKKAHMLSSGDYPVAWKNIGELIEHRAKTSPQKVFLTFYDDVNSTKIKMTYAEFNEKTNKVADLLLSLGARKGDKVATIMFNHIDTVIIYFAALKLGATIVPVNCQEDNERIKFILENSEAKVLFYYWKFGDKVQQTEYLEHTISVGAEGELENRIVDKKIRLEKNIINSVSSSQDALIVYTSGTTGVPKGVLLDQYNMMIDADGIAKHYGFTENDKFMCVLPIHHVNGIIVTLMTPLYVGGSVVLNIKFRTPVFWQRLAEENVNVVSVVPTLLQFLLEGNEDISRYDLSRFRTIICGAGPLTVDLAKRFNERFGYKITHGYGLSESTCYSCYIPTDLDEDEYNLWMHEFGFPSIGIPITPNEMAIHDAEGKKLGEQERGEIVIRGKNIMKEYFKRPDANKETFKNGWFRSGDEGFFKCDDKGRTYFFITGRIKEVIIRGGINISPLEIDEVLNSIPGIARGIAVGFESKWYGDEVGACVQLEAGSNLTEGDIIKKCAGRLTFFKRPKKILFVSEIPVTSTGKYQRNRMKHLFEPYKDVQFREE